MKAYLICGNAFKNPSKKNLIFFQKHWNFHKLIKSIKKIAGNYSHVFVLELRQEERENLFRIQPRRENIVKKLMAVLSVLIFSAGLTACNTFKGIGKDVERGGEKVQDAADKAKK